jgi:O6-methylguanine-DNA--protein-cysteine methyltransferase
MADSSRLVSLASTIQAKVLEIHNHLVSSGQTDPSFDSQVPYTNYSSINDTRASVLDCLTELQDLLSTPQEILKDRSAADLLSRHALDRFRVYDLVPVGETRTYTEIANATNQPVNAVRRILRHAIA